MGFDNSLTNIKGGASGTIIYYGLLRCSGGNG